MNSAGQLVATSINRITKAIRAVHPNVTIMFWDDMVNPVSGDDLSMQPLSVTIISFLCPISALLALHWPLDVQQHI